MRGTPRFDAGFCVLMPWWIWLLPLIVIALVLYRLARRPPVPHRHVSLVGLEAHVGRLLASDRPGAVLVLERESGTGVLQLVSTGDRSVELRVPDVAWSAAGIAGAGESLRAAGYCPAWDSGSRCREVRRMLCAAVDASDVVRAVQITAAALGWQPDTCFTVRLERG